MVLFVVVVIVLVRVLVVSDAPHYELNWVMGFVIAMDEVQTEPKSCLLVSFWVELCVCTNFP